MTTTAASALADATLALTHAAGALAAADDELRHHRRRVADLEDALHRIGALRPRLDADAAADDGRVLIAFAEFAEQVSEIVASATIQPLGDCDACGGAGRWDDIPCTSCHGTGSRAA
jgi:hypothetical protein